MLKRTTMKTKSSNSITKSLRWNKSVTPKLRLMKRKLSLKELVDVRMKEEFRVLDKPTPKKRSSSRSSTRVLTRKLVTRTIRRS